MKIIKIIILSVLFVVVTFNTANSQVRQQKIEQKPSTNKEKVDKKALHVKMLSQKFEFFQKELQLNAEQMKSFWEIYQRYDEEIYRRHEITTQQRREIVSDPRIEDKNFDENTLTEQQAEELLRQMQMLERDILMINEKYTRDFMTVLPIQKVLKLKKIEKKFMRNIMSKGQCNMDENNPKHKVGRR